jgi:hypothetical protein
MFKLINLLGLLTVKLYKRESARLLKSHDKALASSNAAYMAHKAQAAQAETDLHNSLVVSSKATQLEGFFK